MARAAAHAPRPRERGPRGGGGLRRAAAGLASAALRLGRVADVSRTRFTLGRRVSSGAVVLVGYSTATGEIVAGDLDLARSEVGPLAALGRIETLTPADAPACSAQAGSIRFLADLVVDRTLAGQGSGPLHAQRGLTTFLIDATATRLCATAQLVKGTCALEAAPR